MKHITESRLCCWELFFGIFAAFIRDLGRHFGSYDEAYEQTIDRYIAIATLCRTIHGLDTNPYTYIASCAVYA